MALFLHAGFSKLNAQQETIQFLETYTSAEVASLFGVDDRLYQLLTVEASENQGPILGYCQPENTGKVQQYLETSLLQGQLPGDIKFCWGTPGEEHGLPLYAVRSDEDNYQGPVLPDIKIVEVNTSESTGDHSLLLSFTKEGADKWAKLTGSNIGKYVAIVIGDTVRAAPLVGEEIRMGKCQISGNFSLEEARALSQKLDPLN
jgi:SecD/SecF fusion protein